VSKARAAGRSKDYSLLSRRQRRLFMILVLVHQMGYASNMHMNPFTSLGSSPRVKSASVLRLDAVEDIFEIIIANLFDPDMREALLSDRWFEKFCTNVHGWVSRGLPLTTEQARISLRIISRLQPLLVERGWATDDKVTGLLARPVYRSTPTQSTSIPREVRYLGDNLLGFRFKRNDVIMEDMKRMRDGFNVCPAHWDWISRLWIIPVLRSTIQPIMNLIRDHRFEFADDVAEYLALTTNASDEPCSFVIDPSSGKIIAEINDSEIVAAWTISALEGKVL
jgi:hypothetical protein